MKNLKEKGITLIALVITIIVLLILAGVTISIIINNGLIDKTKIATDTYKVQEYKERITTIVVEEQLGKIMERKPESVEQLVINKLISLRDEEDNKWIVSVQEIEDRIKVITTDKYEIIFKITEEGNIEWGDIVRYDGEIETPDPNPTPEPEPEPPTPLELSVTIVNEETENLTINLFDDATTTISAKVTGENVTYKWYYKGEELEGKTGTVNGEETVTLSIATTDMTEDTYLGGEYKCEVTDGEETKEAKVTQTVEYLIGTKSTDAENAVQMKNFATRVNEKGITFATLKNNGSYFDNTIKEVTLITNVDLSTVCGEGKGNWTPIGNETNKFEGTFNGQNHSISNLYINNSSKDYQGLFGKINGYVKNVTINGSIQAGSNVGGIVGHNNGIIEYCINNVNIQGNGSSVAGIVGGSDGITRYCINNGNVTTASGITGGVVGWQAFRRRN